MTEVDKNCSYYKDIVKDEIIIDECFNCKKKKDIADNWRNCKLKCSYKYKRRENDEITRLKQENETIREHCKQVDETNKILYKEKCDLIQENEELKEGYEKRGEIMKTAALQRDKYRSALKEIRIIAGQRFVSGLNEEADCYNYDMQRIESKINEVLNE